MEEHIGQETQDTSRYSYVEKVWIVVGAAALVAVVLLLVKATFSVFLLVLAGALIAIFFHGFAGMIHELVKWKYGLCLGISVIATILFLTLLTFLIGAKIEAQASELVDSLPTTIVKAKQQLEQNPIGQKILSKASSQKTIEKTQAMARKLFSSTFGVLGDIYVVLFIGIFFTAGPETYKKGIVRLVPSGGKSKAEDVLNKMSDSLKKWLKGKLFAMLVVFMLTAIGLAIIGMPLWLVLALIAGLLNFIPNFGPMLAMIPAVLLALTLSPTTAGIVAGMYVLIQVLESNFITPMVQRKLINVPPAMIIIAQLVIGPLTNAWGVILATPIMVIVMVMVKELYIKNQTKETNSGTNQ